MLSSTDVDRDTLCRALVESMSDAVLVLDPEPMRFILANEAATRLLGYSVDQLCTMRPTQLSNAWDVARLPEIGRSVAEHGVWRGRWLLVHQQGQLVTADIAISKLALAGHAYYLAVVREVAEPPSEQIEPPDHLGQYRLTFERSPLPMWIYDRETLAFLAVNQAAIRQYGFAREELMRMTLRDLRDPGDLRNLEWQTSPMRTGPLVGMFVRHRRKDGTLVEAEISSDEIVFNDRPARLVVAKDVTMQRRTEAAIHALNNELEARVAERTHHLRESEERFRALVASVPGLIYRCSPDTWQLQFVGGLVQSITGYPADDFITGARTFASLVDPSDTIRVRREVEQQLAASGAFATEYRLTQAGGQTRWVYERGRIVTDAAGAAEWLDGVVVDITDRKLAEAERARLTHAISQERAMHASILAGISDALLVVGADGIVWYANARLGELLAIADVDVIVGRPLQQLLDGQRVGSSADADVWDTLARVLAERSLDGFDLHVHGPPPRDLRCHPFTIPEMTADGAEVAEAVLAGAGIGLLLHDITFVQEVSRMKDEIIGLVSHELRAPLASVLGFAELLLRRDPPPEQRRQYLTVMLDEGARLTSLISDFLDLEHLRHGLHGVTLVPLDPRDLLIGAVTAADSDPDHPIILDVPMGLPPVLADADRMRQVLWNLLSNARKYSPDPGEIRVVARCVDDQLAITVTDRGVGIPRAALPQLFDRFFRVDERDGVSVPGAGLGLSIVKQLVEAHGGSVWAQSEGLDQGACFGFSLRFAEAPPHDVAS
jgi:PAS domain S-box-containing protein